MSVCDEHAEDATIKSAREKYMERQGALEALIAQAKALGVDMTFAPTGGSSGLVMVQTNSQRGNVAGQRAIGAVASRQQYVPEPIEEEEGMIDASVADQKLSRRISLSGNAGHVSVEGHSAHSTDNVRGELDPSLLSGRVKVESVERSNGSTMAIPTKKVDGLGTTTVRVVQTNDLELQRRFKDKAAQSLDPYGWMGMLHQGKDGYELTNCPMCKGNCTIRHLNKDIQCPKCGGRGQL